VAVHDWMRWLPPAQVRDAIKRQLESQEEVEGFRRGISVDAVLVMVGMGLGPGMRPVALPDFREEAPAAPPRDGASATAVASEPASKPEAEPEAAPPHQASGPKRVRPRRRPVRQVHLPNNTWTWGELARWCAINSSMDPGRRPRSRPPLGGRDS
jgi:hypothetical protein